MYVPCSSVGGKQLQSSPRIRSKLYNYDIVIYLNFLSFIALYIRIVGKLVGAPKLYCFQF